MSVIQKIALLSWLLLVSNAHLQAQRLAYDFQPIRYVLLEPQTDTSIREVVMHNPRSYDKITYEAVVFNLPYRREQSIAEYERRNYHPIERNVGDEFLTTMSVLPNRVTGKIKWLPIQLDTVPSMKRLTVKQLQAMNFMNVQRYFDECKEFIPDGNYLKALNLIPVVKRKKGWYYPETPTSTEYFRIIHSLTCFVHHHDCATINPQAHPFPRDSTLNLARSIAKKDPHLFGLLVQQQAGAVFLERQEGEEFLFWVGANHIYSRASAPYSFFKFRYKPGVGVTAAMYSVYFDRHAYEVFSPTYFLEEGTLFEAVSINGVKVTVRKQ